MPVAAGNSGQVALDTVCENLSSPTFESAVGAQDKDMAFLSELMNNTIVQSLVKAHDTLEEAHIEPVSCDNIDLVRDVSDELGGHTGKNVKARELQAIISNPHFKALVEAHDDVASKNFDEFPDFVPMFTPPPQVMMSSPSDAIRMVGIRKNPDEPLGITVRKEASDLVIARILSESMIERQGDLTSLPVSHSGLTMRRDERGDLVIARILKGGVVDRQGLLHVGDIIKEINGQEVTDPDQLQELMKKCYGSITLKILPGFYDHSGSSQVYLKTHFSYNPKKDNLIPCREAGLTFQEGDILQVLNMEDANWWQAKKVDENGTSGLIPSQTLEEKRKAFVRPEFDYTHKSLLCGIMTKKKRKMMYQSNQSTEFDRHDLMIYEEVARMPPFQRKTLVLVGAQGVGRRTLKQRLIKSDSSRFGAVTPRTSRPIRKNEVDGDGYWYIPRDEFEKDIEENNLLEYGEFEGNFYGTKYDSIHKVINQGKMCVLDLNPQALKSIKTSAFMSYVVFIAAPPVEIMRNMHEYARQRGKTDKIRTERDFRITLEESQKIERRYKAFFDLTIVNDNIDETFNRLRKAIETLSTEPQWVPVSWVY